MKVPGQRRWGLHQEWQRWWWEEVGDKTFLEVRASTIHLVLWVLGLGVHEEAS